METGCQELDEDFNYFVKRSSMDKDSLDEEDKRKKNKRKRMKNEGNLGFSKLILVETAGPTAVTRKKYFLPPIIVY